MGPLSGVRIVEFDGLGPVTFAGMMLADLGADVVRLARADGASTFADVGGAVLHRNRTVVPIDLKSPEDVAKALDLLSRADALIEGFRPGVMERLGLGPDVIARRNPALVYGRITGWGQTGPLSDQVGHDINYIALSGLLHRLGRPDGPPRPPLNIAGDYAGGALMLVIGLLASIVEARSTGRGRVVDAAMTDGSALLGALFDGLAARGLWSERPGQNLLDGAAPFYRCYRCADGRDVAVGALEPRFYAALLAGLGVDPAEASQFDQGGWPALHARFEAIFATADRDAWAARFAGTEACVTPVLTSTEAAAHPHNVTRGTFVETGVRQAAPAPRFDGVVGEVSSEQPTASLQDLLASWRAGAESPLSRSSPRMRKWPAES